MNDLQMCSEYVGGSATSSARYYCHGSACADESSRCADSEKPGIACPLLTGLTKI